MFRNVFELPTNEDQRVRRSRDRLGQALVALLVEKPFDDITVQEVLERAQVSRATFYAHYRDKNDLFLSNADEFYEKMATALSRFGDKSERLAPVQEFFAHVREMSAFRIALNEAGRMHDLLELGQQHFARGIEKRLAEIARGRAVAADRRGMIAHTLAGSIFSLLQWWLQHNTPHTPEKMDQVFHQLAWRGVDAG